MPGCVAIRIELDELQVVQTGFFAVLVHGGLISAFSFASAVFLESAAICPKSCFRHRSTEARPRARARSVATSGRVYFAGHLVRRQFTEFFINQRQQLVRRSFIAFLDLIENTFQLAHGLSHILFVQPTEARNRYHFRLSFTRAVELRLNAFERRGCDLS